MTDGPNTEVTSTASGERVLIGVLAALSSGLIFACYQLLVKDSVVDNGGRQQWWHLAPALCFALPYALMVLQVMRRASYGGYLFVQVQAALGLVAGIPLSLLFTLGAGLAMGDQDPVDAMVAMWFFTIVQLSLLLVARHAKRALAATLPADGYTGLAGMAPLGLTFIAFIGASGVSSLGDGLRKDYWKDVEQAQAMLTKTTACLIAWRREHGAYPEHLEAIVPTGCVPGELGSGTYAGHAFLYNRNEAIGFVLLAEPEGQMTRERLSHLSDASGRVYRLRESEGRDESYAALHFEQTTQASLLSVVGCLVQHAETPDGQFPSRLDEIKSCASAVKLEGLDEVIDFPLWPYRLRYTPTVGQDGRRSGFEVEVRPRQYGVSVIRSYRADESQIIRGTGEDRAATVDDPEVFHCELSWGSIGTCQDEFERRVAPVVSVLPRTNAKASK